MLGNQESSFNVDAKQTLKVANSVSSTPPTSPIPALFTKMSRRSIEPNAARTRLRP
jgi:hypothetical protein